MATKVLQELHVKDLKMELQRRDLSSSGKKEMLMERLGQALLDGCHDPDEYEFRIENEVSQNLKSISEKIESSSQRMKEEMRNMIESSNQGMKEEIKSMNKGMKEEMRNMNEKMESVNQTIEDMRNEMKNMEEEVDKIKEMNQRHDKEMEAMKEQLHKVQVLRINSQPSDGIGKMKPPIFDGLVSWSVYKRQFEAAARINNWTRDEEKATALVLALRGKASELLQTIPDQRDYGAIVKAIELRYGDEHMQEVFRVQLKTRQQKSGESLQELEADIERLAHLSYPSATQEILDVIATDAFIDAIRDPELKQAIRIRG